uniref:Uncharacterized protein n=1 Tax=Fagus sylvatica TaxID=28930 RepID=A0A2N9EWC7_FAGSY
MALNMLAAPRRSKLDQWTPAFGGPPDYPKANQNQGFGPGPFVPMGPRSWSLEASLAQLKKSRVSDRGLPGGLQGLLNQKLQRISDQDLGPKLFGICFALAMEWSESSQLRQPSSIPILHGEKRESIDLGGNLRGTPMFPWVNHRGKSTPPVISSLARNEGGSCRHGFAWNGRTAIFYVSTHASVDPLYRTWFGLSPSPFAGLKGRAHISEEEAISP